MLPSGRGAIASVSYQGEEAAKVNQLLQATVADEDDLNNWESLITYACGLEGGVNRNSSPAAIDLVRTAFDLMLAKFPLLFGYWDTYAKLEFSIGGSETAEMVYQRGVHAIPNCPILWGNYIEFKASVCHEDEAIRSVCDRGAFFCGIDFNSHDFWDKYIEVEERTKQPVNVVRVLLRALKVPNPKVNDYYTKLQTYWELNLDISELCDGKVWNDLWATMKASNDGVPPFSQLESDRQMKGLIINHHYQQTLKLLNETEGRRTFEKAINRHYFHVDPLDDTEIAAWHEYLDFEEAQGDYVRTVYLYERCVVSCALYEEFWLRYSRWLLSNGKDEDARLVLLRASCTFVPISQPAVRLNWARLEEKMGLISKARDIHLAILEQLPGHQNTLISLANLERRHEGVDAAISLLNNYINSVSIEVGAALVAEAARILWQCGAKVQEARKMFMDRHEKFKNAPLFWKEFLQFEVAQYPATQKDAHNRVKQIYELIPLSDGIPHWASKELSKFYMDHLLQYGGTDAAQEYMELDKAMDRSELRKHVPLKITSGL